LRSDLESVDVEVLSGGTLGIGERGVSDAGGALRAVAGEGVEVGDLRDCQRDSGLEGDDAGELPSVCEFAGDAVGIEVMAGADGEIVGPADGGDVGDIAGGDVAVEAAIEGIGDRIVGDGAGEDGGVED